MYELRSTFTPKDLRQALSQFATGVAVVTSYTSNNEPTGMTINSFSSVSMEPPLILWSIAHSSNRAEAFLNSSHFIIHILAQEQQELSQYFATGKVEDFFPKIKTNPSQFGPRIDGCSALFECELWKTYPGGDHEIIIGKVINFSNSQKTGLVFAQGKYGHTKFS